MAPEMLHKNIGSYFQKLFAVFSDNEVTSGVAYHSMLTGGKRH